MSIVVESVSTSAMGSGATITKPTGVVEGDLLLAIVADDLYSSDILVDPVGWTTLGRYSSGLNNYAEVLVCYIVATATEVAASNFTFTNADGGVIYRISGAATDYISAGVGTVLGDQTMVITIGLTGDNDGTSATFSGYSVTGGASPSFTERYDSSTSSGFRTSLGVADALYNSTEQITAFNVTNTGGVDDSNSFLVKLPAIQNATASNAVFQTSPVTFATLTGSTQEPNNDFQDVSPEFFEQSASGTVPTVWTPIAKS